MKTTEPRRRYFERLMNQDMNGKDRTKAPKTTVWMRGKNKDKQDGIYCCECGYFVPLFYDYYYDMNDLKNDYMYCPHCGRKAEGSNTP